MERFLCKNFVFYIQNDQTYWWQKYGLTQIYRTATFWEAVLHKNYFLCIKRPNLLYGKYGYRLRWKLFFFTYKTTKPTGFKILLSPGFTGWVEFEIVWYLKNCFYVQNDQTYWWQKYGFQLSWLWRLRWKQIFYRSNARLPSLLIWKLFDHTFVDRISIKIDQILVDFDEIWAKIMMFYFI